MQELHNLAMLSWVYLIGGKMHDFARFCTILHYPKYPNP